jgi:hypothetical protein
VLLVLVFFFFEQCICVLIQVQKRCALFGNFAGLGLIFFSGKVTPPSHPYDFYLRYITTFFFSFLLLFFFFPIHFHSFW